jgi:hypothetical protein
MSKWLDDNDPAVQAARAEYRATKAADAHRPNGYDPSGAIDRTHPVSIIAIGPSSVSRCSKILRNVFSLMANFGEASVLKKFQNSVPPFMAIVRPPQILSGNRRPPREGLHSSRHLC